MWKRLILATAIGTALVALAGCETYSGAPSDFSASERDKDKPRGNTPVGSDRTGAKPADGAILDPSGAVTKEPVLRDR